MRDFQYYNPSKIIFGTNPYNKIKDILEKKSVKSILMIYGGEYVKKLGIYDNIRNLCKELNIKFTENGEIIPNPRVELVRKLINVSRGNKVDFILAVGGGSAVDTAKAVSMGINYDGDVWDFFEGNAIANQVVEVGVISTIPSSGSETSNATIINNGLFKKGYEDDKIIPVFAVMNPQYTLNLPKYHTSVGISDISTHLLERYFTNTKNVDTTDFLIEGALKALMLNAYKLMDNFDDINARSEIQWLASIAHNNLLDTGRESDWASHRIEHELSAQYDIVHGEGMATVIIAYMRYVSDKNPEKLAQLSNRLFGIDYYNYTLEKMAVILADKFEEFYKKLGLRTKLKEFNIGNEHFYEMAKRATDDGKNTVGHYYPLDIDKFVEVLNMAN